jgi:hypothetical protein
LLSHYQRIELVMDEDELILRTFNEGFLNGVLEAKLNIEAGPERFAEFLKEREIWI